MAPKREPEREAGGEVEVLSRPESLPSLQRPRRFRVLLHDDDFTTTDFVEEILETVFGHDPDAATRIMLDVHEKGIGLAGIFPYEVAEAKVAKVTELAEAEGFPFLVTLEPDDDPPPPAGEA